MSGGGRFDFDDGGTYCGGWEDGKAHGFGVCTGPKGQGEYSGAWTTGFEMSGVYTWPSGNNFEGQWVQGKRHGLGIETKGRWIYKGEWTQGFKGRYGARESSSGAKYEGTWTTGLQDGYGVETYADGGSYQGQWLRGVRHGYGVRQSVPYGLASHYRPMQATRESLTSLRSENEDDNVVKDRDRKVDESRGGFVLQAKSDESPTTRRRSIFDKHGRTSLRKTLMQGLKLRKQKSTGDIHESPRRPTGSVRSTISNISHASADSSQSGVTSASVYTDSNLSFVSQDDITDANVTETYMGEWKNDKRSGFGISERSDGLKYEGEWYNNKKFGYGVTTFKDGTKEEGKYKNNVLISSGKKSKLFLIRSSKLKERVENAVVAAQRAAQIALQKADIAISRMANARVKAEGAEVAAEKARQDSDSARLKAKEYAPEFHQPGTDILRKRLQEQGEDMTDFSHLRANQSHLGPGPHQHRSHSLILKRAGPAEPGGDLESEEYPPPRHTTTPLSALVSSAMDCAIAGSSSHVVGNLHQLEGGKDHRQLLQQQQQQQQQQQPHSGRNSISREPRLNGHRGGGGGAGSSRDNLNRLQAETMLQANARPPPLSRNHSSRNPSSRPEKLSDLLNSKVISDHFDQYGTLRDDSGLGRDLDTHELDEDRYRLEDEDEFHIGAQIDRSPDSGVSDTDDVYRSRSRPLQRRKTLPSIVKHANSFTAKPQAKSKGVAGEVVQSHQNLSAEDSDTYIIENGIRKRIKAEVYTQPPTASTDTISEKPKQLPKRYKLESPAKMRANRGSLPDVTVCKELGKTVMPREEASKLSHQRREELRILREEEERRKQQEIVLRLTDLKDWCQQRQLLMLVITLNVTLATMFFNLLSQ